MHNRLAHTAEHAFIGSLQKLLGQTLNVRKVEHKDSGNTATIVIQQLDLEVVFKAEAEVNALIVEGCKVVEHTFPSLEEAKRQAPGLRANEERISGQVKVIEIEGHDMAACAMEHAGNLKECDFFLVTRMSKNGSEYEVDFVVDQQAKDTAISLSTKLLRVCSELGANVNTIENTAKKLKSESEANKVKLKVLSRDRLGSIKPDTCGGITLLKGVFHNLADDHLQEFAGAKIADENTIVLLANIGSETASVVIARNEKMAGVDCNKLFKQFAGPDGRGGGKPHFVTGMVRKEAASEMIDKIAEALCST